MQKNHIVFAVLTLMLLVSISFIAYLELGPIEGVHVNGVYARIDATHSKINVSALGLDVRSFDYKNETIYITFEFFKEKDEISFNGNISADGKWILFEPNETKRLLTDVEKGYSYEFHLTISSKSDSVKFYNKSNELVMYGRLLVSVDTEIYIIIEHGPDIPEHLKVRGESEVKGMVAIILSDLWIEVYSSTTVNST